MAERRKSVAAQRGASISDEVHMAALGHQQELKRNFSPFAILGLAFAILNSWTALSASLSLALPSGGSTSVLWGLVTAGVCNLCLAASLAEFLSAFPSASGQYLWVAVASPPRYRAGLSWVCGWINVFGWMALTATAGLLGSQLILGIIATWDLTYEYHPWHQFLIYIGYNVFAALLNAFGNSLLPHINTFAIIWSVAGFAIICITILSTSSPNYNSAEFVFTDFINTTGWPDGIAWLLGLLQGGLGLTGFDATAHLVEEIPNAAFVAPKIMIYCVAIGIFTGFIFLMCLLFVAGDVTEVIKSADGPIGRIILTATGSKAGTTCLLMFPIVCLVFAAISIMTTSSRMTYAFARDGGLPFSRYFARVHRGLDVPLESLGLTTLVVIIFGCIFLGSSAAFNAIISASVVALGITYAMPLTVHCLFGRNKLPENRPFKLPVVFGWFANLLGISYVVLTSVLFVFPPALPVDGTTMNYCIVAFAIVLIISGIQWIVDGRKNFGGPKVDIDALLKAAANGPLDPSTVDGMTMPDSDLSDGKLE